MSESVTRKARLILADIQEKVEIEAKNLSNILSEISSGKERQKILFQELSSQETKIKENGTFIATLSDEIKTLEEKKKSLEEKNVDIESKIETNQGILNGHNNIIAEKTKETEISKEKYSQASSLLKDKNIELHKVEEKIKEKTEEFSLIEGNANEEKKKLEELKMEQQEIDTTIELALSKFKVFQSRMNQFTSDTGYIVGYPRPIRKVKK